jgi:hypothetical protein
MGNILNVLEECIIMGEQIKMKSVLRNNFKERLEE